MENDTLEKKEEVADADALNDKVADCSTGNVHLGGTQPPAVETRTFRFIDLDPDVSSCRTFDPDDLPEGTWLAAEGQIVSVTDTLIEYKGFDDIGRRLDPPYRLPETSAEQSPQVIRQGVSGEDVGIIVFVLVLLLITAISTAIFYHEHPPASETWKPNEAAVIISQQEAAKAANEYGKAQAEYGAASIHRETALRMQVIENCAKSGNIPVMIGGNVDCKLGPK